MTIAITVTSLILTCLNKCNFSKKLFWYKFFSTVSHLFVIEMFFVYFQTVRIKRQLWRGAAWVTSLVSQIYLKSPLYTFTDMHIIWVMSMSHIQYESTHFSLNWIFVFLFFILCPPGKKSISANCTSIVLTRVWFWMPQSLVKQYSQHYMQLVWLTGNRSWWCRWQRAG